MVFKFKETHADVANFYTNSKNKNHQQIGNKLYSLRVWRNKTDYDDVLTFNLPISMQADKAIEYAEFILEKLN
ncbi:hypothetical protein MsAc7_11010 [Methanolapillus millepedarum]|uniref:Uncharacterized protein n=2 Tax=Methanolapillus millepedarum TaxID=3028296 RepID=A0AA96ZUF5_9EURY|nr:hypothetical protein MsAc7_11010 [Methanosarcinaceae archaeon Ac7]